MAQNITQILSDPVTGSLLGIAGIISTAIVGVTIFLMQKQADHKFNKMIEEHQRVAQRKSFWIKTALDELNEVKQKHEQAQNYVKEYPHRMEDSQFLEEMRQFFTLENFAFIHRHIPLIQEAGDRLVNLAETETVCMFFLLNIFLDKAVCI
jgi:hypothetical protein